MEEKNQEDRPPSLHTQTIVVEKYSSGVILKLNAGSTVHGDAQSEERTTQRQSKSPRQDV